MDNKTKIKVAIVIGVVIIALIFIGMIFFVEENRGDNPNIPTKSVVSDNTNTIQNKNEAIDEGKDITIEDTYSLALKDDFLVKIKDDFTSENVLNIADKEDDEEYWAFSYDEGIAYLLYFNEKDTFKPIIYSVDLLKSNYPKKKVVELDEKYCGMDFNVYNNKIYYSTVNDNILEYSINEEKMSYLLDEDSQVVRGSLEIDKENNLIYYIAEKNNSCAVYKMDLGTNESELIISGFSIGYDLYLYKNKYLICSVDDSIYIYNSENKSIWKLGSNSSYLDEKNIIGNVAFYEENYIIYTDGQNVVLKDFDGNVLNESLYGVDNEQGEVIFSVCMLVENKLQIEVSDVSNSENNARSILIDLEKGLLSESDEVYTNVLIIK